MAAFQIGRTEGSIDPESVVEQQPFLKGDGKEKKLSIFSTYLGRRRLSVAGTIAIALAILGLLYCGNRVDKPAEGGARSFLGNATLGMAAMSKAGRRLQVSTWNIAAINNNPFEYWITYNKEYEDLMVKVETFLDSPGDKDVAVPKVFSQSMFDQLDARMTSVGWQSVKPYWENDFSKRTIVEGFMKDGLLGLKRLASMPDRMTNTINTEDGNMVFRPTIINMYEDDLSSQEIWWEKWSSFMFDTKLKIKGKGDVVQEQMPYQMLQKIKRSKYKAVTEEEEKDSLPLQTMCGAIFDAILVHMMNTVSTPDTWQPLKRTMVQALNKQKVPNTLKIMEKHYMDSDIITLQEVSASLIDQARKSAIGKKFHIIAPANLDAVRDQNSVVCLKRSTFPDGAIEEITAKVEAAFPKDEDIPVSNGDILAVTTKSIDNVPFVVASFHGDTNGLATKPVVDAILKAMGADSKLVSHRLVFGLDANTYEKAIPDSQQDVLDFGKSYVKHGLTSCWGDVPDPKNYTTFNARTFLQPQLNKACRRDEKRSNGDVNPKDFILFPKDDFQVVRTWKDNTGKREYVEDMAFPTLDFPSDHGILTTIIEPKF